MVVKESLEASTEVEEAIIGESGAVEATAKFEVVAEVVTPRRLARITKDLLPKLGRNQSPEAEAIIAVVSGEKDRTEAEAVTEATIEALATVPEAAGRKKRERLSPCKQRSEEIWV